LLRVNINDLTFNCIIGILDQERKESQKVILDLSFEYYYKDDGSNFVDYAHVAQYVEDTMKNEKFRLIEEAILFIRKGLKNQYDIINLKIKIAKPDILNNCIVSVEE